MKLICQFDDYTTVVSELTGRTVYINDSLDQYLISPDLKCGNVAEVATQWQLMVESTAPHQRPPVVLRKAVAALKSCRSREEVGRRLQTILVTLFREVGAGAVARSQRYLVDLMLQLWSCGAVAWPAKVQVPFSFPVITLETLGVDEPRHAYLLTIHSYVTRSYDMGANFRFLLDHILARVGLVEIGDLTPMTFYASEERCRLRKLKTLAIQGVLGALRDVYPNETLVWKPQDFGFLRGSMGRLARDDKFNWLVAKDSTMAGWAQLAVEHIANNPANFSKRKGVLSKFLTHYVGHRTLPRNPAEYFDVRRRPTELFNDPGNKGRGTMSVVHEFLNEVLFKVCAQPDDNEIPILMP